MIELFRSEDLLAYTEFLGLGPWLRSWQHANPDLATRIGIPPKRG